MNDALVYAIQFVFSILSFLFVARFLLQACRVDFYNPISQGFIQVTDPILKPLRLAIPGFRNLDIAAFLAAVLMEVLLVVILSSIVGQSAGSFFQILVYGFLQVLLLIIRIFWWSILIVIIASFIAPGSYHPALGLMQQITEPLMAPARKLLPPMGGLDFSPILVFLLLGVLERILPQVLTSVY
jgi:YggT family protein